MATRNAIKQPQTGPQGFARTNKHMGGTTAIVAGDLVAGGVVQLFIVPKGFVATGCYVAADKLDTDGAPTVTVQIGDSGSATRFTAALTTAQAGGNTGTTNAIAATGLYYKFLADTIIQATFVAGAATPAAGNLTVYLSGFMDG